MKRLLNVTASDLKNMGRDEILHAIKANEGRTVMSENVCTVNPIVGPLTTNTEVSSNGVRYDYVKYV